MRRLATQEKVPSMPPATTLPPETLAGLRRSVIAWLEDRYPGTRWVSDSDGAELGGAPAAGEADGRVWIVQRPDVGAVGDGQVAPALHGD